MRAALVAVVLACGLGGAPAPAAELQAALGVFMLAPGGADVALSFRAARSHWRYGVRYARWVDTFSDPFTGNDLTETTSTLSGATLDYLLDPDAGQGWYLGVEALRWAKAEHSLLTGETGTDEVVAPFLGGGYLRRFARRWYWDLGMFIAPGAELAASTSVSSEEDSGGFDVRVQVGVSF